MASTAEKVAIASKAERIAVASRAEMYRGEARECEEEASKATDRSVRHRLIELAQQWRELADQIEQTPSLIERWWPTMTEDKTELEQMESLVRVLEH